jgi:Tfp pilus assembly protein PilF
MLLGSTVAVGAAGAQGTDYLTNAESLQAKGQLKAAEIQLKNAVRSDPTNMAAHYRLALIELQLGEAVAAEHEAKTARTG